MACPVGLVWAGCGSFGLDMACLSWTWLLVWAHFGGHVSFLDLGWVWLVLAGCGSFDLGLFGLGLAFWACLGWCGLSGLGMASLGWTWLVWAGCGCLGWMWLVWAGRGSLNARCC